MTIGAIGNPSRVPKPTASELQRIVDFIAGMGSGDKKTNDLIAEMKDVQTANEKLFKEVSKVHADAVASLEASAKAAQELQQQQRVSAEKFNDERRSIDTEKARLAGEASALERKRAEAKEEMDAANESLAVAIADLETRTSAVIDREDAASQAERSLIDREQAVAAREKEVEARYAKMRELVG